MNIKQKIISLSKQAGACSIGFADIVEVSEHWQRNFDSMVSEGRHGTMAFMERNRDLRTNPALLLEGAKTLISLAFSYDKGVRHSRIASYALVQDYHFYLKQILAPIITFLEEELGAQCRICVDSAPVAERFWALRTGVGVKGRNQQLMVPGVGSRVFLAEILTTATIEPDPVITDVAYADVCIGCDRCVRACPNGALEDPQRFDARKCVSYLTIEHRGDLPEGLNLAGKIYGCDICLDACPYNHIIPNTINLGHPTSSLNSPNSINSPNSPNSPNSINNDSNSGELCSPSLLTPGNKTDNSMSESSDNRVSKSSDKGMLESTKAEDSNNFYSLQEKAVSPFEIDTDILSLTTQDIENMTSGQYRRLTKRSAMSRCPLPQLRRNL